MKRSILVSFTCVTSVISFAQNVGIGTTTPTSKLHVVGSGGILIYAINSGASGYAIVGESNGASAYAIRGLSANGVGVYGESATGSGVKGYGNDAGSIAVFGSALAGTGVKAYSYTGKALDVIGNLSISGGNTNPSNGAVLTSDAAGNAIWKNNKIGFEATSNSSQSVSDEVTAILVFDENTYDPGNDFNINSAVADKNTFIVPVSGFYHLDASCTVDLYSATTNLQDASISFYKNGTTIEFRSGSGPNNSTTDSNMPLSISNSMHLNAGDKITIRAWSNNLNSLAVNLVNIHCSGFLVHAD